MENEEKKDNIKFTNLKTTSNTHCIAKLSRLGANGTPLCFFLPVSTNHYLKAYLSFWFHSIQLGERSIVKSPLVQVMLAIPIVNVKIKRFEQVLEKYTYLTVWYKLN